jgi:adenosylcobinamide-GDP ribazoletransferase
VIDKPSEPSVEPPARGWRGLLADVALMVRFYSRLPVPALPFEGDPHRLPDFGRAPRMLALAGLIIAAPAAFIVAVAAWMELPPLVAAAIGIAALALASGAFHEDGLADTFDGLAGGRTPERRLEIMKDSRIGAFGGTALMLALILRVALLAALLEELGAGAAWLVLAAAALSRSTALLPLVMLPPARAVGVTAAVGRPTAQVFVTTTVAACLLAGAACGLASAPLAGAFAGLALSVLAALVMAWWAARAIRGQTGDIAGAAQQAGEIGIWIGLLLFSP